MTRIDGKYVDKWIELFASHIPDGVNKRLRQTGTKGRNQILEIGEFLECISQYADPIGLQVSVVEPEVAGIPVFIFMSGQTLDSNVLPPRKRRLFQLDLVDAWEDGVKPETVKNFRNVFGVKDSDDRFYAPRSEIL